MTRISQYLSPRSLRTLERLGDIACPGEGHLPRFSATGCLTHVDQILEVTPAQDVRDLNRLLTVISVLPDGVLRWLLRRVARAERAPAWIRPLWRQLDLGLRGVLYSLYYSGKGAAGQSSGVLEALDYHIHCEDH